MILTFKTKALFFDRKAVTDQFGQRGRKTLAALSRAGAFVRTRARSSLRRGGRKHKSARAGEPPRIHTQNSTISLKNIQFAYDPSTGSVVVGSVLLNNHAGGGEPVPGLLEHGGTVSRFVHKGNSTLHYSPHPWMQPALDAERPNIPSQWASAS